MTWTKSCIVFAGGLHLFKFEVPKTLLHANSATLRESLPKSWCEKEACSRMRPTIFLARTKVIRILSFATTR